jgi:hypothetical protein
LKGIFHLKKKEKKKRKEEAQNFEMKIVIVLVHDDFVPLSVAFAKFMKEGLVHRSGFSGIEELTITLS